MIIPPFDDCDERGYLFIYSFNDEYCVRAGETVFYIEGGVPPYKWFFDSSYLTFLGSDGDAPNDGFWNEYDPSNYLDIKSNKLNFDVPNLGANYIAYVDSVDEELVSGDFDIRVNFEVFFCDETGGSGHKHLAGIVIDDGVHNCFVGWGKIYRSMSYAYAIEDIGLPTENTVGGNATYLDAGTVRVYREGSVIRASYRGEGEGEGDWRWTTGDYRTFNVELSDKCKIRLYYQYAYHSTTTLDVSLWDVHNYVGTFPFNEEEYFSFRSMVTSEQYNFVTCAVDTPMWEETTIYITDSCGTEVSHKVVCCDPLPCCDKPDYSFSYSGENPISVELQYEKVELDGGCPPYKWEVTGSSYTLAKKWTNAPNNILKRETAHGSGTSEVLTVTDACDTVINIDIIGCCDDPAYSFDFASGVYWGSVAGKVYVEVVGGCPPFTWKVDPPHYMDSTVTTVRTNVINLITGAGTYSNLIVSDICGDIKPTHTIYNCLGDSDTFEWDWEESVEEIGKSSHGPVYVKGGVRPFTWEMIDDGGGEFWLGNSTSPYKKFVYSSASACGSCVIKVTDYCLQEVIGSVRCTEGQWVFAGS
jgi:hypothetical protein